MNTKIKDLLNGKKIVNVLIIVGLLIFIISIFCNLFLVDGMLYYSKDDMGNNIGAAINENLKAYNYLTKIPTKGSSIVYFEWDLLVIYILVILVYSLNFIKIKNYDKYKQIAVTVGLLLLSVLLFVMIGSYQHDLKVIFKELIDKHGNNSYVTVSKGEVAILAYAFTFISGLLSLYKVYILYAVEKLEIKKPRRQTNEKIS